MGAATLLFTHHKHLIFAWPFACKIPVLAWSSTCISPSVCKQFIKLVINQWSTQKEFAPLSTAQQQVDVLLQPQNNVFLQTFLNSAWFHTYPNWKACSCTAGHLIPAEGYSLRASLVGTTLCHCQLTESFEEVIQLRVLPNDIYWTTWLCHFLAQHVWSLASRVWFQGLSPLRSLSHDIYPMVS